MHSDLRTAIRRTKIRALADDRRAEEMAKAVEEGLATDDLLEIDRRRLKRETERCEFEDKAEKMRDPLARLFKTRKRNGPHQQKKNQKRRKTQNEKNILSKNQRTAKKKAIQGCSSTEELDGKRINGVSG